jgi:S-adenosylmethionine:tRNA ribosyltransferase-isomerase
LPAALEASEPPEARGLARDGVRLLVSDLGGDSIQHARFHELPRYLDAGDLLVVNASGTLNAALLVLREGARDEPMELHLSTRLPGGFWTVELRRLAADGLGSLPCLDASAGEQLLLPGGGRATLLSPYPHRVSPLASTITLGTHNAGDDSAPAFAASAARKGASARLWLAALSLPSPIEVYLERYGFPIRYRYVPQPWPATMYQTVFATAKGSAEMPSAGRPFTTALVERLLARGVQIAPLLLHTGVASLERHEPPFEEYYDVPRDTAARVNAARRAGRRIIAVGTTVVRALETVTDDTGVAHPGTGWTDLVITPDRPLRSVDSLITGLHEPRATHLMMLDAIIAASATANATSPSPLRRAYEAALRHGYLWHEFGDSHLILGARRAASRT